MFNHKSVSLVCWVLLSLAGCGGGDSGTSSGTTPPTLPDGGSSGQLSAAQQYVSQHSSAIRSLTDSQDFSDLKPIADAIGRARIVQLGESSHGSGSMNTIKTRLIKYLHQQHGFNLLAFESSVFACNQGFERDPARSAVSLLRSCLFGVWHTEEVAELFRYILSTQQSSNPLRLTGFDVQMSGEETPDQIERFFRQALQRLGSNEQAQILALAQRVFRLQVAGYRCGTGIQTDCDQIRAEHSGLTTELEQVKPLLAGLTQPQEVLAAILLDSYSHAITMHADRFSRPGQVFRARDAGMAANTTALLQRLYPTEKMLIWAHNAHIAEDFPSQRLRDNAERVMGMHLHQQWQDQLFTLALLMLSGQQADNNRTISDVTAHRSGSLEANFMHLNQAISFMPFSKINQAGTGDDWLHQSAIYKDWGRIEQTAVLANTFDAVLMIRDNQPPRYLAAGGN
jgi:erythromycin esterase